MFDINRARMTVFRQIRKFGATPGNPSATMSLVREGVARACTGAVLDYSPRERGLVVEGAKKIIIANWNLTDPPDHERDVIRLFNGEVYRIVSPVKGARPGGVSVYYECECQYDTGAA